MSAHLDLRLLRQFLVLAEELHFGRAAQRLHMTQPPLSLAIQRLERELGEPLFARTRRSVALTAAGEALALEATRLLAAFEQLPGLVRAAATGEQGRLRLGFVSTVGYGAMPQWLRSFREQSPGIALSLREATLDVQLDAFDRGDLDAGFVIHAPGAVPAGFDALTISQEPMLLAHAEGLAFGRGASRLARMLAEPLVIFPREIAPSLFDALLGFYRTQGITPQIAQQAIQMQTIVNLVSAGIGVAWVPQAVCALQREGVRYSAVPADVPQSETSLIWRPEAQSAAVVQRFVSHVREALSKGMVSKVRAGQKPAAQHNARTPRRSTPSREGR